MFDSNNRASLRAQTALLRLTQVVAPIVVLVGTIYAGAQVDAFVGPADNPVNSPMSAAMIMGVFMFPGGAFFIARGLVYWSRARAARFWPAVKGHIAEDERVLPLSYLVPYWYVVNGIRYDSNLARSGAIATGKDIAVHFDPEDPNIGVVVAGDATARLNIGLGCLALATPFPLGWLLVWLGS